MSVETYLPIFSGHYEGYLQGKIDDAIELELEHYSSIDRERTLTTFNSDKIQIDYPAIKESAGEYFTDKVKDELSEYITDITYQATYSPRFYNFGNDSINVSIEPIPLKISSYIYGERNAFERYVKDRYTSRPGFISSHPDTFEEWETDTKSFKDYSKNSHVLGTLLDFIAFNEDIEESDLWDGFNCNGEIYNHITLINM